MAEAVTHVMIFGAGFGTRMRPLTEDRPKPLVKVAGRALIDHALDYAGGLSPVVNAHYRADQLAAYLKGRAEVVVETPDILDTGGGLKAVAPRLNGEAVATLNSDALFAGPDPLGLLLEAWDPVRMDALLLMVPATRTGGDARPGDFALDADGRLLRTTSGDRYTGVQIIKLQPVIDTPGRVFSLNAVWDALIAKDRAFGLAYPGRWADVGTPAGIPLAEAMLADG